MTRTQARFCGIWLAALLLAPGAAAAKDPEPSPILLEAGRGLFRQHCSSCHGLAATGDGPVAKALRTPPADLTRIAERRGGDFPAAEITTYIDGRADVAAHGPREMPIWGQRFGRPISEDTTADEVARGHLLMLVEYLRSIQK
jgi:mono/diheme cytochrome c family protein